MIDDPCDEWPVAMPVRARPMIAHIQRAVADVFNIEPMEMQSERRSRVVARPRQVAMYLSKQMTSRSLPEIGQRFGGRDHTTVIHAIKQIERLRQTDGDLDANICRARRQIEEAA